MFARISSPISIDSFSRWRNDHNCAVTDLAFCRVSGWPRCEMHFASHEIDESMRFSDKELLWLSDSDGWSSKFQRFEGLWKDLLVATRASSTPPSVMVDQGFKRPAACISASSTRLSTSVSTRFRLFEYLEATHVPLCAPKCSLTTWVLISL